MNDYDELLRNYATAAAQDLRPLVREAAETLGMEDEAAIERLGLVLAKAWMAGAQAGQAEVIAQALEKGVELQHTQLRAPPEDDVT